MTDQSIGSPLNPVGKPLVFRDLVTGANTSGKQFVCYGEYRVVIDPIPEDAPQDWEMGPTMRPGEFGAFIAHEFYACGHGPYAFAVGKDARVAFQNATVKFAGNYCEWPNIDVTRKWRAVGEPT